MRRRTVVLLLAAAVALSMGGCSGFRERAAEMQARLEIAEATAALAERGAAQNAARLLDLEERIEILEELVGELMLQIAAHEAS